MSAQAMGQDKEKTHKPQIELPKDWDQLLSHPATTPTTIRKFVYSHCFRESKPATVRTVVFGVKCAFDFSPVKKYCGMMDDLARLFPKGMEQESAATRLRNIHHTIHDIQRKLRGNEPDSFKELRILKRGLVGVGKHDMDTILASLLDGELPASASTIGKREVKAFAVVLHENTGGVLRDYTGMKLDENTRIAVGAEVLDNIARLYGPHSQRAEMIMELVFGNRPISDGALMLYAKFLQLIVPEKVEASSAMPVAEVG